MTAREPYKVQIKVRLYELDPLGHLNHAVYHSYGEVARIELMEAAAGEHNRLREEGFAPVLLASQISYRRELRMGDVVNVTCDFKFGTGKTFEAVQTIVKVDGTLSAEITCTLGLMDLERRKLVENPRGRLEQAGYNVALLSTAE